MTGTSAGVDGDSDYATIKYNAAGQEQWVARYGASGSSLDDNAVAIARATAFDAKVVIMDEPTAALAIKEVGKVLDLIKTLKDHGVAVIMISHRMDDIFYACDRVMALFHGANFADSPLGKTNRNEVIGWIMGTKDHTAQLAHDRVH